MDVWHWTSLVALLCYAGLRAIPNAYYQAAQIDGASRFAVFRYIELPKLRGVLMIAVLLRFMQERLAVLRSDVLGDDLHELLGVARLARGLVRDDLRDRAEVYGKPRCRLVDERLLERRQRARASAGRRRRGGAARRSSTRSRCRQRMRAAGLARCGGVESLALVRVVDVAREHCVKRAQIGRACGRLAHENARHWPYDSDEPALRRGELGVVEDVSARRLQRHFSEVHHCRLTARGRRFADGQAQREAERPRLLKAVVGPLGQGSRDQVVHCRRQLQRRKL